ncbi:quinone oxidoreductase family protein [Sphingomonas xinjiangensis]|uniref:NADPH2:quinone reductase n=1 Tax=Sphingomonas xinjiangensis TaxID=643568 RepID=A0A840YN40_9SPHN|nr:quinone oxidoreductase [Sphingomonas xinjiangensis]MBB5711506.1 NADPH2:quinone reductase [Sphingomonas xinjiangensis]
MARAARIERTGGPEVIGWAEMDLPDPGPGEVRMRNTAIGLNFIDTYHRSGLYKVALPSGLGLEAAGVIEAVGKGVEGFAAGDRVATFSTIGAYATARNIAASSLFKLPDDVSSEVAAAALLKGCTVEALVERAAKVQPGWTVLVHAAAGGVGQLLVQWLKAVGVTVIGTVGRPEKVAVAHAAGADHVLMSRTDDVAARVREITGGEGVPAVFDGVGAATWETSLKACARRGLVLSYGNASGPVEGVNLASLNDHGSLFATRLKLYDYYTTPQERAAGAARLFGLLASGAVRPQIGQRFALEDAVQAHRALEAGNTTGSTLLMP